MKTLSICWVLEYQCKSFWKYGLDLKGYAILRVRQEFRVLKQVGWEFSVFGLGYRFNGFNIELELETLDITTPSYFQFSEVRFSLRVCVFDLGDGLLLFVMVGVKILKIGHREKMLLGIWNEVDQPVDKNFHEFGDFVTRPWVTLQESRAMDKVEEVDQIVSVLIYLKTRILAEDTDINESIDTKGESVKKGVDLKLFN